MNATTAKYEINQLRGFIERLEDIRRYFSNMEFPTYLTDEQKLEWQKIMSRYNWELGHTVDKAAIELDKESWYDKDML